MLEWTSPGSRCSNLVVVGPALSTAARLQRQRETRQASKCASKGGIQQREGSRLSSHGSPGAVAVSLVRWPRSVANSARRGGLRALQCGSARRNRRHRSIFIGKGPLDIKVEVGWLPGSDKPAPHLRECQCGTWRTRFSHNDPLKCISSPQITRNPGGMQTSPQTLSQLLSPTACTTSPTDNTSECKYHEYTYIHKRNSAADYANSGSPLSQPTHTLQVSLRPVSRPGHSS